MFCSPKALRAWSLAKIEPARENVEKAVKGPERSQHCVEEESQHKIQHCQVLISASSSSGNTNDLK